MWNHSHSLTSFCNKLDYIGILVLMWGAGIPTIHYGFICDPHLQNFYSTMVCRLNILGVQDINHVRI